MALSIDHIVISVNDVNTAIETYQKLGFTAFYGGKHASGLTHNGLVVFDDGSYLELIGFVEPNKADEGEFYDLVRTDKSEGYTGFALISDNMEVDIARMRESGIDASEIKPGSRTRTDGEVLKWKMSSLDDGRNPFVITDVTPRILRVPAEGDNIEHKNTSQGIADLQILVDDLSAGKERYTAIVGTTPVIQDGKAVFALASGTITLAEPDSAVKHAYFKNYGSVPYQVTLIGKSETIESDAAHGARFVFTG